MNKNRVWLVTGCSTGFGRILAKQILAKGERLVATARNVESLKPLQSLVQSEGQLLTLPLDVTSLENIQILVETVKAKMGRIDVLINNAGYGAVGAIEEVSREEVRRVFETNFFGLLEMTKAVLPEMRAQKSGFIINLSSVAGMVALPGAGIYAATKFAVEALSESLAGEVAPFGIKVSLIEPGGFRTDFANRSLSVAPYHAAYDESLATTRKYYETIDGNQPGDPEVAARIMIELVDHPNPPLRLPMGKIAIGRIHKKIEQYLGEMEEWEAAGLETDYPEFR